MKSFRIARETLIAVFVFNEYNAYEYSPMNKSINKFLADQNVIQSL